MPIKYNPAPCSVEELRSLLDYDPGTGVFTLKRPLPRGPLGKLPAGSPVGNLNADGYISISVFGKTRKAHRLAWFHVTGEWPQDELDHLNGNRSDNRIRNLARVTRAENNQNRRARTGATGVPGVCKKGKRFAAQIAIEGVRHWLGTYDTPEDAHRVYLMAKRRLHTYFPAVRQATARPGNGRRARCTA